MHGTDWKQFADDASQVAKVTAYAQFQVIWFSYSHRYAPAWQHRHDNGHGHDMTFCSSQREASREDYKYANAD
ncbi:hypothetical protein CQ011_10145 [Arthrobacter sp. MYb213]|nr:hypothetical protein CQ011_10145 [Arthrobacter sp. MYb213]